MNKNVVFIEDLVSIPNLKFEQRMALWVTESHNLESFNKIVDIGAILSSLFEENNGLLEEKLYKMILSIVDVNTIGIVDTAYAGFSLFERHKSLYDALDIHLNEINNKDVRFFLCQPLKFMGRKRFDAVVDEYTNLRNRFPGRVYLFVDNQNTTPDKLIEHECEFLKWIEGILNSNNN